MSHHAASTCEQVLLMWFWYRNHDWKLQIAPSNMFPVERVQRLASVKQLASRLCLAPSGEADRVPKTIGVGFAICWHVV